MLHSFNNSNCNDEDGADPQGGLTFDNVGNLYGTTFYGGTFNLGCSSGCGTVFELLADGKGKWTEKVLHRFNNNGRDGIGPYNTTPILDTDGNLYGTTLWGGVNNNFGGGTVFELKPDGNGKWTEEILHSFNKGTDGSEPVGSLLFDSVGNLYGATYGGGKYRQGTVFEITR